METSSTQASGASYPPGTVGGSCADGFGHTQSMTQTPIYAYPGSTQQVGTSGSATLGGTRNSSQSGSAPSVSCTPTASASASSTASSSLTYTASVTAVAIQLTGTTVDSSGGQDILVGQHWGAQLLGIPSGTGWSVTYQWSISGTTFQSWTVSADKSHTTYVDGPGPLTNPTAGWYWNDPNNATETITCTANVTPPSGQGQPFTVTATQSVKVMLPDFTAYGTGGYMQVNNYDPNISNYALWAGPTAQEKANGQSGGMHWQLSVTTPTMPAFGTGKFELVQIVTPNDSYTTDTTPPISGGYAQNGVMGSDSAAPYLSGSESAQGVQLSGGDSPGQPLQATVQGGTVNVASTSYSASFTDYLMYQPPGTNVQWVPLAKFPWSFSGSAQIPITHDWADYSRIQGSDSAGTVTPNTLTDFSPWNTFPSWTNVDASLPQ